MDVQEIMMKVARQEVTFIREEVRAQFDNYQQVPLGFKWRSKYYEVLQPLLVSKRPGEHLAFLVLTDGGVFSLALVREDESSVFCRSKWMLDYQVKENSLQDKGCTSDTCRSGTKASCGHKASFASLDCMDNSGLKEISSEVMAGVTNMLVPLELANIVFYHGHLCPELVVGYRAGLLAQEEMSLTRQNAHNFFIMAENFSPAIDALQYLTGCTIGNGNFYAYDLGKHVYYFTPSRNGKESRETLRVALINPIIDLGQKCVERRIMTGKASHAEVEAYQKLVDEAVEKILNFSSEALFKKTMVSLKRPQPFLGHDYSKCSGCGEIVATFIAVKAKDYVLCPDCAVKRTI